MKNCITFECEKNASPDCWGLLYLSEDSDIEFLKDWIPTWELSESNKIICPECAKYNE